MRDRFHRLQVDHRYAARHVLHHAVEHAFAVAHRFFRSPAQIDGAEHVSCFRVANRRVFSRVAEDIDALAEGVEVNAIRLALPASIVLISFIVSVSNMEMGLLLVNPCPDLGSTTVPWPPMPAI